MHGSYGIDHALLRCSLDEFLDENVAGHAMLINVPTSEMLQCVKHYMACKQERPWDTSACFVIPKRKGPWTQALSGFHFLHELPKGTVVLARDENGHLREVLSKWPLRVYYDAPVPRSLNALTGSGGLTMQFEGSVAGVHGHILLDSAASEPFLSAVFCEACGNCG